MKLEVARSGKDGMTRDALLTEIRDETKAAITEVRRSVDELRPPAIDEMGLSGAIRQRAASLSTDELVIEVHGPPTPPPIPAAVEVAAFRIASEAMTNVVKHSGANRCRVALVFDQMLELTVSDNGRGNGRPTGSGVGWSSMTERAAELGGTCSISDDVHGGLLVRALLPLREDMTSEVLA
jgi:signal transduction histidine kinase